MSANTNAQNSRLSKSSIQTKFNLNDRYTQVEVLGEGSQGCVISAQDNFEGYPVAIKRLKCNSIISAKYAYQELMVLKHSEHYNIIELTDQFTQARNAEEMVEFYLVMPKMGGTIASLNLKNPNLEMEKTSPVIIHQLLLALKHLHDRNIIHRDVKPANIGLEGSWDLKLLDLGLAREKIIEDCRMTTGVTTLHYRAPEVLMGLDYGSPVDMWAVGCLLAELLTGEVLFKTDDEMRQITEIFKIIGQPDKEFLASLPTGVRETIKKFNPKNASFKELFPTLNNEARDLLSKLLVLDPKKRLTAQEALAHPYLESDFIEPVHDDSEILKNHSQLIKTPNTLNDIKKEIFKELQKI